MTSPFEQRQHRFMQGIDPEELKRKKEEDSAALRKDLRTQQAQKRRHISEVEVDWIDTDKVYKENYDLADLRELVEASSSHENRLFVAQGLRKMLSLTDPPIQQVVDAGFVFKCVEWISSFDYPQLQYESAWILTNIASGTPMQCKSIIDKGAIPLIVKLLSSSSESVRDQAAWVLGNISAESAYNRDLVISAGALELLMKSAESANRISMLKNVSWALSNLCRHKPAPDFEIVKVVIPTLAQLCIDHDIEQILQDITWAFSYLSYGSEYKVEHLIHSQVIPRMVELMLHPCYEVQLPAIRTVGNLTTGTEAQTQHAIDNGAIEKLKTLMHSARKMILKESVWLISNVAAGTKAQVDSLITADLFPDVVRVGLSSNEEIEKEACYAIANAASNARPDQVEYLVRAGVFNLLAHTLKAKDSSAVLVSLHGLGALFEAGKKKNEDENPYVIAFEESGGLSNLEHCQMHENEDIYEKASELLCTYFTIEEEDTDALAAAINMISRE
mmetsp:Transcript_27510/g.49556  ORF Transcript_27510/g.49556 Transcript_27510/m.49556 type:complete len:503 (+) Transcript_27510:1771-3279(+)|eukprot:CAMPEP_0204911198 /NCGR_PEP_ID=MMETSP1397-20131031/9593_1 /ASSEMBLY_ACC=CAM_ASM_000891 /TAXON_ID=49980 /ORGANISM="Climacostomum Climacostomum virens, Strain Stock W-24" /LENGTH=502 /DNA_ID=CAMNT_0052081665 /DNA_START=1 /DNA_END=1509 /DNA_ORIENTATION=+